MGWAGVITEEGVFLHAWIQRGGRGIGVQNPSVHYKQVKASKYSKTLSSFLFLFSNKMLVFRAGTHKMLARIANRKYPDRTASEEAV